jgi:hypothetical protein
VLLLVLGASDRGHSPEQRLCLDFQTVLDLVLRLFARGLERVALVRAGGEDALLVLALVGVRGAVLAAQVVVEAVLEGDESISLN